MIAKKSVLANVQTLSYPEGKTAFVVPGAIENYYLMNYNLFMQKHINLKEIEDLIVQNRPLLDRKFKVKNIGIFGSYVRGEQKDGSDLDILVEFREKTGFFKFLELEEFLEKLLHLNVDLVSRKALKPRIGQHILNEIIML